MFFIIGTTSYKHRPSVEPAAEQHLPALTISITPAAPQVFRTQRRITKNLKDAHALSQRSGLYLQETPVQWWPGIVPTSVTSALHWATTGPLFDML